MSDKLVERLKGLLNRFIIRGIEHDDVEAKDALLQGILALLQQPVEPAKEQPVDEYDLLKCARCLEMHDCLLIPTGFAGETEPLCGRCIGQMLGEAHELMEAARKKLGAAYERQKP